MIHFARKTEAKEIMLVKTMVRNRLIRDMASLGLILQASSDVFMFNLCIVKDFLYKKYI